MNINDQDRVKCAQLDMLVELKRICEKNGIAYFLVGGTLIGAIRHCGFIPWDDDIDVGMLREDYERFISLCKTELSDEYALYDWHKDEKSPIPFLKMKIKGTHYREKLSKETTINDEIFIDIFPYDNAPDSGLNRKIQALKNIIYKKIILLKCGFTINEGNVLKKFLYIPLQILSCFHAIPVWKKKYEKNASKYNRRNTSCVVSLGGSYSYNKEVKYRNYLSNLTTHKFENVELSVPKEYDSFLRQIYGDYMMLPPENERVSRHGILLIDLGEYKPKSNLRRESNG